MPFVAVWLGKTERCWDEYHLNLSLGLYDIVHNENETWWGEYIVTMGKIGLYPYIDTKSRYPGRSYNGGIPQLGNLTAHLAQVEVDIQEKIPDEHFRGLALIDWEAWKPVWGRNWDSRKIYQVQSIKLVQQQHPDWPQQTVLNEAIRQFQSAAQLWMEKTLEKVKLLRPNAFWGYYEFPDCFNNKGNNGYHCSQLTIDRNNQIQWLFNASTALYPSIYAFSDSKNYTLEFKYNILESLRVDNKRNVSAPIYPYALFGYDKASGYVSYQDLVATVGQSADLGMAGIVFWGDAYQEASFKVCNNLKQYINSTLGPYVLNVTQASVNCSMQLCSGHGRCYVSSDYYWLSVEKEKDHFTGFLHSNWVQFKEHFECQCYVGWSGVSCDKKS
jgi:hyaluronoglucosaminidase